MESEKYPHFEQIQNWIHKAIPHPNDDNLRIQFAVHIEEVAEMLATLINAASNPDSQNTLKYFHRALNSLQESMKSNFPRTAVDFSKIDRVALLDSICDQMVTLIGIASLFNMDIEGGLKEVSESNNSKFDAQTGKAIFNDQKKIIKGPDYYPPNLLPYV